jgi:primosomal protein N'
MLFGSTEKHYTASKTFQCLLSERPLLSMLHNESSAVTVIKQSHADQFLMPYRDEDSKAAIVKKLKPILEAFQNEIVWNIDLKPLDTYTSKQSAKVLAVAMDKVLIKEKLLKQG